MGTATRTKNGMEWNGHLVECWASDDRRGWVVIGITTKKTRLQVYITKTGKIRINDGKKEWKP